MTKSLNSGEGWGVIECLMCICLSGGYRCEPDVISFLSHFTVQGMGVSFNRYL